MLDLIVEIALKPLAWVVLVLVIAGLIYAVKDDLQEASRDSKEARGKTKEWEEAEREVRKTKDGMWA